ncbi:MAG: chromate transporter [Planctomycetes bacterium]|nr:chromate transporter [Planctomycetota bacterium]
MIILLELAWVFLKIGLFCWGGGIVIIPLVENEVVWKYGWLTQREFIDSVTLGQISPGPIIISASFIGYKVCGVLGAVIATISVVLPSFVLICLATKAIKKFKDNRYLAGFFHGARAAVIGMIFEAAFSIGRTSLINVKMAFIAVISLVVLVRYKISPIWVLMVVVVVGILSSG